MIKLIRFLIITAIIQTQISCSQNINKSSINKLVYRDSIFTKKFDLREPGFTGGDATYSVLLPDGRTVWIFGDTFIGTVSPEMTREKTNPMYIRNCFVVQDREVMKTITKGKLQDFISVSIPTEVENGDKTELDVWYWPGDGYVHNNTLNVFMSKFHQKEEGMWGFEFIETDLIQYSLPDLKELKKIKIPYSKESGIHFGHAVFETKEHLYIYGLKEQKPYVARTAYETINTNWEFFNENDWTTNIENIKPMHDMDGSEQFSIIKLKGEYVFITQLGSLSKQVYSFTSKTPYGPWKNQQLLFETPIDYDNKNLFTYNALAHPQFTKDDCLLISYNTNSFELEDHFTNAGIYRPRFMQVPISLIFNE